MNKYDVVEIIPIGRKNAISMSELSMRMGEKERNTRKAIFEARRRGAVICSTCGETQVDITVLLRLTKFALTSPCKSIELPAQRRL
ncbi:MAG: hypothetical protein K2H90_09620 [Oscillospiraceae bacterium]|nr:hypothetical protein [Oscillospiraceae bacterium]